MVPSATVFFQIPRIVLRNYRIAAKAADSGAKLYITDNNMNSNNTKTQAMIRLISRINASAKYIEGVGSAMHLYAGGTGGVEDALTALAGTGIEVAIVDLQISGGSTTDYLTVMRACLHTPQCVSITEWDAKGLLDSNYVPNAVYEAQIFALGLIKCRPDRYCIEDN